MDESFIRKSFLDSIECMQNCLSREADAIKSTAQIMTDAVRNGRKILIFGNGGSAADAQHLAAELINRLTRNRPAIPAIALTTDTSVLTSIANDYDFENIFARQIEAFGRQGDIALAISTSGNSPNIKAGITRAKTQELITVGLLGGNGGRVLPLLDYAILVPSTSPQRIQETQITIGHILCEWVETELFSNA